MGATSSGRVCLNRMWEREQPGRWSHDNNRAGQHHAGGVQDRYGTPDVLELERVETPTLKPSEVLLRVRAAGVNHSTGSAPRV